jgi:hypothetical protein
MPFARVLDRVVQRLEDDSEAWGVRPIVARAALVVPWLAALALAATLAWRPLYRFLTKEDGPIEWGQVVVLVAAAVVTALLARELARRGSRGWATAAVLAAIALAVLVGEEISWGQRIFDWELPDFLSGVNRQGETNLHNIGIVERAVGVGQLVAGAYGATAALLLPTVLRGRLGRHAFVVVPPMLLAGAFGLAAAYRAVRYVFVPGSGFVVTKFGELAELALYAAILATAWLALRRLRAEGALPSSGEAA